MRSANKNGVNMMRFLLTVAAILLTAGILATTAIASSEQTEPPSHRTGTASIAWVEEDSGDGGGSGGGGSEGGGWGGGESGGGGGSVRRPTFTIDRTLVPGEIVSIPNPAVPLGRLPETGGNYLIPLILLLSGIFLVLVYVMSNKGKASTKAAA